MYVFVSMSVYALCFCRHAGTRSISREYIYICMCVYCGFGCRAAELVLTLCAHMFAIRLCRVCVCVTYSIFCVDITDLRAFRLHTQNRPFTVAASAPPDIYKAAQSAAGAEAMPAVATGYLAFRAFSVSSFTPLCLSVNHFNASPKLCWLTRWPSLLRVLFSSFVAVGA